MTQATRRLVLSEVVLRTSQYETMRDWYVRCLDQKPMLETRLVPRPGGPERVAFFRVDSQFPYTQTLAVFEVPHLSASNDGAPGLHHFQIQLGVLPALFDHYELLRDKGIKPTRSSNHGPSTSFYYADPDRNVIEVSAQNYETEAEQMAYIQSEAFRKNPSGIDVDPEAYVGRYRAGTPIAVLRRIP
jgi:catechol-2,3-dioxygenase